MCRAKATTAPAAGAGTKNIYIYIFDWRKGSRTLSLGRPQANVVEISPHPNAHARSVSDKHILG